MAWAAGGAVARRAATTPAVAAAATPQHTAVATTAVTGRTRWGRRWVASRGCGGRGCPVWRSGVQGACVACFVLGWGSERHVPGSPVRVLTRRSPRANYCPCFPFAAARVSAAGGGRSGLRCGLRGACPESDQGEPAPSGRTPCPSAPWVLLTASSVGLSWSPSPPFIGAAMHAPHQGLVGVPGLHCIACGMPRS